jgi:hypothetical protein
MISFLEWSIKLNGSHVNICLNVFFFFGNVNRVLDLEIIFGEFPRDISASD